MSILQACFSPLFAYGNACFILLFPAQGVCIVLQQHRKKLALLQQLLIVDTNIFYQRTLDLLRLLQLARARIAVGNLIQYLDLFYRIQKLVYTLQCKARHGQTQGAEQTFPLLVIGIAPGTPSQQRLTAQDKLPGQSVFWLRYLPQLLKLRPALLPMFLYMTGNDLFFQRFQVQLAFCHHRKITGIRQAQPLQQGVEYRAPWCLKASLKARNRCCIADAFTQLLLCQFQFLAAAFDIVPHKHRWHKLTSLFDSGLFFHYSIFYREST